jgi:hypothetical protein
MTVLSMREKIIRFEPVLKNNTRANQLEETSRTLIDIATGTDAYAQIQGNVYGISLRVRELQFIYT